MFCCWLMQLAETLKPCLSWQFALQAPLEMQTTTKLPLPCCASAAAPAPASASSSARPPPSFSLTPHASAWTAPCLQLPAAPAVPTLDPPPHSPLPLHLALALHLASPAQAALVALVAVKQPCALRFLHPGTQSMRPVRW